MGDEGEGTASPSLHRRFDAQRLPPKKAARVGTKAEPPAVYRWAALLSLKQHFCAGYHFGKNRIAVGCTWVCITWPLVPKGKRLKLRPRPLQRCRDLFFIKTKMQRCNLVSAVDSVVCGRFWRRGPMTASEYLFAVNPAVPVQNVQTLEDLLSEMLRPMLKS